jgi:hypothetical protein
VAAPIIALRLDIFVMFNLNTWFGMLRDCTRRSAVMRIEVDLKNVGATRLSDDRKMRGHHHIYRLYDRLSSAIRTHRTAMSSRETDGEFEGIG